MIKNLISKSTAGGGKTTALLERINLLRKNGVTDNKILVISFTNSTCDDIYNRSGIKAQTVHSFCYHFLSNSQEIVESANVFVKIFLNNYFYLSNLGIEQVSNLVGSYGLFQNFAEDLSFLDNQDRILNEEFKELVYNIEEEKKNHCIMFFSDIIHKFKKSIDEFLFEIGNQYDHLLLDETQDLSYIQLEIMYKIIEEIFLDGQKTIYIVGDPKQSIYSFQGANQTYYEEFLNRVIELYKQNNLPIFLENKQKTYRFGGEILDLINKKFTTHESNKTEGKVLDLLIDRKELCEYVHFLINYLDSYAMEDIMVLYAKNSTLINELQEHLNEYGCKIKVWLKNTKIVEGLFDILGYCMTKNNWYKAKILQGPFYYMKEPHFFFVAKNNLNEYDQSWFDNLIEKFSNASEIIEFLSKKKVFCSAIELKLLGEIYILSKSFVSLSHLLFNLPESMLIESPGLRFSTIHSAKGLESKVVIFINLPETREKTFVSLNPFFFLRTTDNKFINDLKQNNNLQKIHEKNNVNYVALTRAKEVLINIYFA